MRSLDVFRVGRAFRMQKRPQDVAFDLYMFSGYPYDKPRFNNKASVRAEAYKVPCSDRRFSYEFAADRYLILVVPGARLGSVSLASVWKCSVYTFLPSRNIS